MQYKRNVRFQYFQIWSYPISDQGKPVGSGELFDLVDWIDKIKKDGMEKKAIEVSGIKARIECCKYEKNSEIWAIRFMRLRDTNIPSKVKENEEAEVIELEDDEYIGEDITMIYEKKSGLAMVQSNRFSLGISKIEELLSKTYGDSNIFINFRPILNKKAKEYSQKNYYKTFEISFANVQRWQNTGARGYAFNSLMNLAKKIDCYTGKLSIGLGHSRADTLNQNEAVIFIQDLQENKQYVRSAKVKVQKIDGTGDDENDVEIIDLFEDIFQDIISFTLRSKEALDFKMVVAEMSYCFEKKKQELYQAVQYKVE